MSVVNSAFSAMVRDVWTGDRAMGKAARNEIIKYKANLFNNVAVGLIVTGALVPYLVFSMKYFSVGALFVPLTLNDYLAYVPVIIAMVLAFTFAALAHSIAINYLQKLED
jgi:hypothetical protein